MNDEYFFGVTLSAANKELKWEPDELKENGTGDISLTAKGEHCLMLKQALLTGGVDGEVNTVEIETSGYKNNVKLPIISLIGGKSTHVALDLSLPDPPVTLRLIEGTGPIHISGNHAIQTEQYQDDDDDDEDDFGLEDDAEDDEDEDEKEVEVEEKPKGKAGKKRNNSGPSPSAAQPTKKKRGAKEDA